MGEMKAYIPFTENKYKLTLCFVTALFMLWGIAITMGDVLNKYFQSVLNVSKADSGLVQFSIFGAYFIMSIPAGLFMKRFGYKYGVILGLALFAFGSFLFVPAAGAQSFSFFRVALFVLGCGLATLETVAHPFMAALGDQRSSDRRVNFAQAFNAVGTMIGPALGAYFLLGDSYQQTGELAPVKYLYMGIGGVILLVAIVFSFVKVPSLTDPHTDVPHSSETAVNIDLAPNKSLFAHRHFVWAVASQFFNVAAQGGTWAFFINYGNEVMGFSGKTAANYMVVFMGMMLAGRFVGTFLMKYIAANRLLAIFALANIVMCIIVAQGMGWVSFVALLFINFFFSIMFPTIFSLGIKNLGQHTQQASSFIAMGVVGGAIFPFLMGLIANHNIAASYYLPIICYLVIFLFGAKYYRVKHRSPAK